MTENFEKNLIDKRNEFGRNFIYSLFIVFLLHVFLNAWLQHKYPELPEVPISIYLFAIVATGYLGYLFSKTTFSFKTTYTIISVTCGCLVFYLCLLLCHIFVTIFYFYVPIILLILLISDIKTTVLATVLIAIACAFTNSLAEFFNFSKPEPLSRINLKVLHYVQLMEMFTIAYMSFFILYYYKEIKILEVKQHAFVISNTAQTQNEINTETTSVVKVNTEDPLFDLYKKIIQHFDSEKPYQNPDFNIKKLADIMETNTTYVSRALNTYGAKNFSTLVNEYRVAEVKEGLLQSLHLKFTLEHVYSKAGFKKQPTFNRVFKEQTGYTPSEYIKIHQV